MRHRWRAFGSLGVLLCCGPLGRAADPDFSAGFKQLLAVGVPDTHGCKLVEYDSFQSSRSFDSSDYESEGYDAYQQRSYEQSDAGKTSRVWGWLTTDGKQVIDGLTHLCPVLPAAEADDKKAEVVGLSTETKPVSAAEILQRYEQYFKERKQALAKRNARRSSDSDESPEETDTNNKKPKVQVPWRSPSEILLLAAEIWRSGEEAAGNRLANLVLTNTEDPMSLLKQAVGRLALEQYSAAMTAFYEKKNWGLLATQLDQVVQRFPRDWQGATGTRLLISMAKARSAQPQPTPPKLEGSFATPENTALLARLSTEAPLESRVKKASAKSGDEEKDADEEPTTDEDGETIFAKSADQPRPLWFLHPPPAQKYQGPLQEILAKGLEAIPLLVACLNDTTLNVVQQPYWTQSYHYQSSSESNNVSTLPTTPDEILSELQNNQLDRPATLHELASPWLLALFGERNSYDSDDEDAGPDLKTRSMEFYQKWKSGTPLAIVWHYLNEPDPNTESAVQKAAIQEIIKQAPDEVPKLEMWLLQEPVLRKFSMISLYVRTRGSEGAGCLEKFGALARKELQQEELRENSNFSGSLAEGKKRLESSLKQLSASIHGASLAGLLEDIASGKLSVSNAARSLYESLGGKPPTQQHVNELMAAAAKPGSADSASSMTYLLSTLHSMSRGNEEFPNWTKNTPEKLEVWKHWLEDERPLSFHTAGMGPAKQALAAAALGNNLASPQQDQAAHMLAYAGTYARNGDTKDDFLLRRAKAWVAGEPLPKLEKLPDEESKALLKTAAEQTSAGLPDWYAKLTSTQRICLWLEAFKARRFPPVWIEAATRIHAVDAPGDHPWAKAYDWPSLQGQQLTSELCKKIGTALAEAKMPPGTVMIKQDPLHGALHLVFQAPLTAPDATSLTSKRPPAGSVLAYALSYFGSGNAVYANDDSSSEDTDRKSVV